MTHPLTDEIIENISSFYLSEMGETGEGIKQDIRAGADWQLKCDAEWWKIILNRMKILHPDAVDSIVEEFKRLMRPQQQEDNQ